MEIKSVNFIFTHEPRIIAVGKNGVTRIEEVSQHMVILVWINNKQIGKYCGVPYSVEYKIEED